ncbi:OmpA family protein [Methylohalobius crimeensis]|uniref:OmpA family protein n=1 Tax=Methylohalobius crimeensis TaxID=244365 RepID=UPI0003B31CA7|nr:OmpA family protein [Methylohalobius crimeensis]
MNTKPRHSPFRHLLLPLALAACGQTVLAGDVRLFTEPPSADEMGKLLFPDKTERRPKTRSLTFNAAPSAQPAEQAKESVAIALPIQFDFNSAKLREEAKPFLDEIGRMLTMDQFQRERLIIEGHTDASGSDSYNEWLSQQRAKAVKEYLYSRFSVEPERLQIVGRGEHTPLPDKDPFDPLNRRVELHRVD